MATFSVTANELKYASGSSWTSGKARQGVYSGTRYEGAINLTGLADLDFSNIAVSQIQMRVTFGPAGGDSTKYLTFYKATKNSISGSIASMRGDSIGSLTVAQAYNRTVTLTFSASTNASLFNTFRDYFASGNRVLLKRQRHGQGGDGKIIIAVAATVCASRSRHINAVYEPNFQTTLCV